MCLIKTHETPKKSEKEIKVYKILIWDNYDQCYRTPFMFSPVIFGQEMKARWQYSNSTRGIDGEGVHAFITIEAAISCLNYLNRFKINDNFECTIFEAIIPSNTEYWEGEDDEIASIKMIITKKEIDLSEIDFLDINPFFSYGN